MNSIESLKSDFHSQIENLGNIRNEKIFDDCVYVGSGDSYVAGLIAEFLTDHKCRCYSPSDLKNSKFSDEKTYCFISVTGKTKANLEIARQAVRAGVKTVAITFNKDSKLAEICEKVIPVEIPRTTTPNAGFSTFVANVVTCLQIIGIRIPPKFDAWSKEARDLSQRLSDSMMFPRETVYVLGNNLLYPTALYASLQLAEFFGTTAIAHKLEEFCHSPIFGLKDSHCVWILGQNEEHVSQTLQRLGQRFTYIELHNTDVLSQLFKSIFLMQNLILILAEKNGYKELQYVKMKDVLEASSDIIYDQIK